MYYDVERREFSPQPGEPRTDPDSSKQSNSTKHSKSSNPQETRKHVGDTEDPLPSIGAALKQVFDEYPRDTSLLDDFSEKLVGPCSSEGRLYSPEPQYFKQILHFFVPLFIWNYNQCKRRLAEVEIDVEINKEKISTQEDLIKRLQSDEDVRTIQGNASRIDKKARLAKLFAHGTALEIRMSEEWQKFIASRKNPLPKVDASKVGGRTKRKLSDKLSEFFECKIGRTDNLYRDRELAGPPSQRKRVSYASDMRNYFNISAPDSVEPEGETKSLLAPSRRDVFSSEKDDSVPKPGDTPVLGDTPALGNTPATTFSSEGSVFYYKDMLIDNARREIGRLTKENEELGKNHDKLKHDFNIFRRCLAVLFDDNLFKLALSGDSYLRLVLNTLAHSKAKNADTLRGAISHLSEVIAKSGMVDQDPKNMDYKSELRKLLDIFLADNNYFFERQEEAEFVADSFIANMIKNEDAEGIISDHHILLQWLDSVLPIGDQQAA